MLNGTPPIGKLALFSRALSERGEFAEKFLMVFDGRALPLQIVGNRAAKTGVANVMR